MRLILVRHGETHLNAQRTLAGHLDVPLSPRGELQAELLAKRMANQKLHAIYASDLKRAKQTAEVIANPHRLGIEFLPELRERNLGPHEGLPETAQLDWHDERVESLPAMRERARKLLEILFARHESQLVLVCTHYGFINAILSIIIGLDNYPESIVHNNTGITIIDLIGPETGKVILVNSTSHLPRGSTSDAAEEHTDFPHALLQHLRGALDESELHSRYRFAGEHNHNYHLEGRGRYLLRLYNNPDTATENEWEMLRLLDGRGAPKALYKDFSLEHIEKPYIITEFIQGAHVESLDDETISKAAQLLKALHDVAVDIDQRFPAISPWTQAQFSQVNTPRVLRARDQAQHVLAKYEDKLQPDAWVLVHGDPTLNNMIIREGQLYFIDWEFSRWAPALEDVAAFISENRLTTAQEDLFLQEYGDVDRERLELFKLRRKLDAVAWAATAENSEHIMLDRLAWLESQLWQLSTDSRDAARSAAVA